LVSANVDTKDYWYRLAYVSRYHKSYFGIGYTISVDTNNVLGIRGVTPPTRNPNRDEILVCAIRLPKFPTLYAAASLDAAPSTLAPSMPYHRHRQPHRRSRLRPRRRRRCPDHRPRPRRMVPDFEG
jgi:hypothetical protein